VRAIVATGAACCGSWGWTGVVAASVAGVAAVRSSELLLTPPQPTAASAAAASAAGRVRGIEGAPVSRGPLRALTRAEADSFPKSHLLARHRGKLLPMAQLAPQTLASHLDRLSRAATLLCASREEAEDLVQETLLRVLARPRRLREERELAYLLRALRNTFVATRRSAASRPRATASLDNVAAPARAGETPEATLAAHQLLAAVAQLPPDFRRALVAVDLAGLSYREAAAALGTREATIATRLHRARARLAQAAR